MTGPPGGIFISKAPDDPDEKEKWANHMMRIQIAMWIGDAACQVCGHKYTSVDDFLRCNPKGGYKKLSFVCSGCWKEYEEKFQ